MVFCLNLICRTLFCIYFFNFNFRLLVGWLVALKLLNIFKLIKILLILSTLLFKNFNYIFKIFRIYLLMEIIKYFVIKKYNFKLF